MRRLRSLGIVGLLLASGLLAVSAPAGAHALLRSSTPADGAQLSSAPSKIVLEFTETPDPEVSSIQLLDASGAKVAAGKPQPVTGKPADLQVSVGQLPKGVFTVTWRVVSKVDGHVTAGSFAFGVGESPGATTHPSGTTAPTTPSPAPLSVVGRWALYWGLALLLAAVVTRGAVFRRDDPRMDRALGVAWLLGVTGITMMMLSARSTIGVGFAQLLRSSLGHNLVEQTAGIVVGGVGILLVTLRRRVAGYLLVGLGALGAMWFHAAGSHAELHMTWFNVPVQFVHIAAVGIWVGGLVWLLISLRGIPAADRGADVRRFSWLFGITLGIVAVTGILRALDEIGGIGKWRDALSTSFGVALLIKIGLFVALVALGARNRYVNVPAFGNNQPRSRHLSRTVAAEVVLAIVILGTTAVLSQLPPPVDIANAASGQGASNVVVTGHDFATSVRVKLIVTPGVAGENTFAAQVVDFDTGKPVPAKSVTLAFTLPDRPDVGGSSLKLARGSSSMWTGKGTNLSLTGRWAVTVTVQEATTAVEVPLTVQTRTQPQHITTQSVPGQPTIYTISLPTGGNLQTYIDPGHPGINNVHFTFFKASGKEEPIASGHVIATDPQGHHRPEKLIRFDKGHFATNARLSAGRWTFEIDATTRSGAVVSGHFSQNIS